VKKSELAFESVRARTHTEGPIYILTYSIWQLVTDNALAAVNSRYVFQSSREMSSRCFSLSLSLPIGPISAIYHFIFRRAARSLLEIQISLSLLVRLTRESQSTLRRYADFNCFYLIGAAGELDKGIACIWTNHLNTRSLCRECFFMIISDTFIFLPMKIMRRYLIAQNLRAGRVLSHVRLGRFLKLFTRLWLDTHLAMEISLVYSFF